jgi:hypothetical protein
LLAVCLDVAELLAVMALRKTILNKYMPPPWLRCSRGLEDGKFLGILPSSARLLEMLRSKSQS